jgi:leader peptidase (prepilin peptidase)/N-methyltransferase
LPQLFNDAMMRLVYKSHRHYAEILRIVMFSGFSDISNLLQQNSTIFITFSVLFGLMVGSFLNVVIHRLPKMMEREWYNNCLELQGKEIPETTKYTLANPRSACPNCGHKITALENIPIISYLLLLRGKCSACKASISMRYPLIEALTGLLIGLVSWKFGYTSITLFAWIFTFALISLTFIDFDTQLLPDDITLPLLWLGLLFNLNNGFIDIKSAVVGAIAGYLILWFIYWAFKLVTGKEGMGYGDFKLLAAIGAWFGWQLLPAVILLSSVLGAVIGISLILFTKRGREIPMPFGPFLAIGAIAALFLGPQLASYYLT